MGRSTYEFADFRIGHISRRMSEEFPAPPAKKPRLGTDAPSPSGVSSTGVGRVYSESLPSMNSQAAIQRDVVVGEGEEEKAFCLPGLGGEPVPGEASDVWEAFPRQSPNSWTADSKAEEQNPLVVSGELLVEATGGKKEPHPLGLGNETVPNDIEKLHNGSSPNTIQQSLAADVESQVLEQSPKAAYREELLSASAKSSGVERGRSNEEEPVNRSQFKEDGSQPMNPQESLVSSVTGGTGTEEPKPFFRSSPPPVTSLEDVIDHQRPDGQDQSKEDLRTTTYSENERVPLPEDPNLSPDDLKSAGSGSVTAPQPSTVEGEKQQHHDDQPPNGGEIDLDALTEAIAAGSNEREPLDLPTEGEGKPASGQGSFHHLDRGLQDQQKPRQHSNGAQEAEFEEDSSPYQSSEEDSSDDSSDSSEDSGKEDEDYELLDPAEAARRLMQDDGGSDDEGNKKGAANSRLRTANEVVDETIEIPNIEVTPDMKVEELGSVEAVIDNSALIKGQTTAEYQVLDSGSLLCLADRKVIGLVGEPLGRVEQPRYCVLFPSTQTVTDFGLTQGTTIYYVPTHSKFVFTKSLQIKGSDASNLHDEEVGADEVEFSDDEAEAEYKRQKKLEKLAKKGINVDQRSGDNKRSRRGDRGSGHHPNGLNSTENTPTMLNYEENDEPYTPLARPSNLYQMSVPGAEFPQESLDQGFPSPRGRRDRGFDGRGRGRGDRGRGARGGGDRGRGGGHHKNPQRRQSFQSQSNGRQPDTSLPAPPNFAMPQTPGFQTPAGSPPLSAPPFFNQFYQQSFPGQHSPQHPHKPMQSPSFPSAGAPSPVFNTRYPALATPTSSGTYNLQQFNPNHQGQYGQTGSSGYQWQQPPQSQLAPNPAPPLTGPMLPPGAFVNPNFFPQQPSSSNSGNQSGYHGNFRAP